MKLNWNFQGEGGVQKTSVGGGEGYFLELYILKLI